MITLDQALDSILQLPLDQQELLVEIWHRRWIEARRQKIAADAQTSMAAFRAGRFHPQPVDDIIAELRQALDAEESPE